MRFLVQSLLVFSLSLCSGELGFVVRARAGWSFGLAFAFVLGFSAVVQSTTVLIEGFGDPLFFSFFVRALRLLLRELFFSGLCLRLLGLAA